jgi:HipA-like C-terminal domain
MRPSCRTRNLITLPSQEISTFGDAGQLLVAKLPYNMPIPQFPSGQSNSRQAKLRKLLDADPRSKKLQQIRDTPPIYPPKKLRRAAIHGFTWGLSRTLLGYEAERDTGIQGKAPKWVIRGPNGPDDFFIAKFGKKNGRVEVLTELLNNRLGELLGFEMAHSGIVRCDEFLYFITRNFRKNEALIHGSLLVAETFAVNPSVLDQVQAVEQEFYSIDFIRDTILMYCDVQGEAVFQSFINMLVFDALIGSQDRHSMNWGVLRPEITTDGASAYRLAPLFDSARALLWDLPEGKLLLLDNDHDAIERYVIKSKPCIGPLRDHPKVNHCNHFDFIAHLREKYPHQP